ncbi:hypothetical protein [Candidatus Finniella inopinata]|uniref:Uncharacterized protein n=1 Tax=Candidatus Finniella inopinata TaxID=1696036 RepID=A0A4Q7DHJ2_9PROT|nr:hypothetical protein [Candidatus Finniella inopinata]RZI45810.1 hypothetical protein EQU50_05080 [Candidatus Finniella inopinata]
MRYFYVFGLMLSVSGAWASNAQLDGGADHPTINSTAGVHAIVGTEASGTGYSLTYVSSSEAQALVTFVVPGVYFQNQEPVLGDYLTNWGEGLLINCQGTGYIQVPLTKDWNDSSTLADGTRSSTANPVDPAVSFFGNTFNWVGSSAAFLPNTTYQWTLVKTDTYEAKGNIIGGSTLLSGSITIPSSGLLARTYQLQVPKP